MHMRDERIPWASRLQYSGQLQGRKQRRVAQVGNGDEPLSSMHRCASLRQSIHSFRLALAAERLLRQGAHGLAPLSKISCHLK